MSAVREGIEEEVGQPNSSKMVWVGNLRRENEAFGGNAMLRCYLAQALIDIVIAAKQPQNAVGNC